MFVQLNMKHKKSILIALLVLLILVCILGYAWIGKESRGSQQTGSKTTNSTVATQNKAVTSEDYLLEGYPSKTVPLYKSKKVSASKFFVNKDPQRFAGYFGKTVNYFNVVFETEATPQEYLNYYRSLMSEANEESVSDSQIEGTIGKYKVEASHYGDNPENYGYLQVYLPEDEYQSDNRYFQNYPNLVEFDQTTPEYESSYGLLNQKGGEVEYTQYFLMPQKDEDRDALIQVYQEKHQAEQGYSFDEESGTMKWQKNGFTVTMTFSKDHGRIYLMIRKPMDK